MALSLMQFSSWNLAKTGVFLHTQTDTECLYLHDELNKGVQQQFLLLLLSYTGSLTYYIRLCLENKSTHCNTVHENGTRY